MPRRAPLTRERLLRGAMDIADRAGLAALTMRSLADEVGVKPMSLYHHVANKEDILDGIVDLVFAEIALPRADGGWRAAIRRVMGDARAVLRAHPWAIPLLQSRTNPGPVTLRYHDAVLGVLRGGGFAVPDAALAFATLDAFTYGFALQEAALPFDGPETVREAAEAFAALPLEAFPHLTEVLTEHVMRPGYDFGAQFEVGLDLILDGFERRLATA